MTWERAWADLFLCFLDLRPSLALVEHQKEMPESQTPRITEWRRLEGWKGHLELHQFNPSSQAGPAKASCPGLSPDGVLISPGMEILQLPWEASASAQSTSQS